MLVVLQIKALAAQYRAIYWLRTVAFLAVLVLINLK